MRHHYVPQSSDYEDFNEVLRHPFLRYWKRLYGKELSLIDQKQEVIALLGHFKVKTPKELSAHFNRSLGYVYKLIQSIRLLCERAPGSIGEMLLAHPEILAEIFKVSPEAAASYLNEFLDQSKIMDLVGKMESTECTVEQLEEDLVLRFILTLAMECRASAENIQVSLQLVLGYNTSTSTIEGLLKKYEEKGREEAEKLDMLVLPRIIAIALDEIFQHETPIFTVVDLDSTYAILIKPKEDRKGETWQEELEILQKLGLDPEVIISDACGSILKAVPKAFEDAVTFIDIFHVLKGLNDVICQAIRNIEKPKTEAEEIWKRFLEGVRLQDRTWEKLQELEDKIPDIDSTVDDIRTLRKWIIEMVDFSGYTVSESKELLDWCLEELEKVTSYKKLTEAIKKFNEALPRTLKYLEMFTTNLEAKAEATGASAADLHAAYRLRRFDQTSQAYEEAKKKACKECRCSWQEMTDYEDTVSKVIAKTPRASSLVENLNSRIRPALIKKKTLTAGYLNLLRLYLNTRPYKRSRKEERKGKSPYEIITGDDTVNFFTLLGISVARPSVLAA